jgi:hypothetical protein
MRPRVFNFIIFEWSIVKRRVMDLLDHLQKLIVREFGLDSGCKNNERNLTKKSR